MAGGHKKIHEHPNAGKNDFSVRGGADGGRPKKLYSEHIADLKKKGYQPPTRTEYFDMVGLLLAMEEDDLKEFAQDKNRPYWIRLIVIDMNSKATRQKMMSDYRDWLFGKAEQKIESKTTTGIDPEIKEAILKSLKPLTEDE